MYFIEKQQKNFLQNKWAVNLVNPTSMDEKVRPHPHNTLKKEQKKTCYIKWGIFL